MIPYDAYNSMVGPGFLKEGDMHISAPFWRQIWSLDTVIFIFSTKNKQTNKKQKQTNTGNRFPNPSIPASAIYNLIEPKQSVKFMYM
jgi:hypothetical protein